MGAHRLHAAQRRPAQAAREGEEADGEAEVLAHARDEAREEEQLHEDDGGGELMFERFDPVQVRVAEAAPEAKAADAVVMAEAGGSSAAEASASAADSVAAFRAAVAAKAAHSALHVPALLTRCKNSHCSRQAAMLNGGHTMNQAR